MLVEFMKLVESIKMGGRMLFGKEKIKQGLIFWVGHKCTLRCRDCCNLMPYLDPELFDSEAIVNDLKILLKYVCITKLQIQGGEPFVHNDIDKIISKIAELDIPDIEVATNGTTLLSAATIKTLKENTRVKVRISNYECVKNKAVVQQLRDNNIDFGFYDFLYGDNSWFYSGGINETLNDNDKSVQRMYLDCANRVCLSLINGTLYTCGKILAIRHVYKYKKKIIFEEVNVRKGWLLKFRIIMFFRNQCRFREACRYCLGTYKKVPAAIQLRKE